MRDENQRFYKSPSRVGDGRSASPASLRGRVLGANRGRTSCLPRRLFSWTTALVCGAAICIAVPANAADEPTVHGLTLVPWSKKIGEDRYRSSRDWEGTLKYFRERYRGSSHVKWHREVNLPKVKFIHLQSLRDKWGWSGLNIYQLPNGEVRLYVLERLPAEADKSTSSQPSR